jgi:hypothetical protein
VNTEHGGPSLEYQFAELKWRYKGDANWREAWYEMYEPDDEVYFFAHLLDAEFPRSCAMVCFDMKSGLATLVKGTTGTPFRNNETTPNYYFGTLRAEGSATPPTYQRHGWTEEMTGECVTWNYSRGNPGLTSTHFYMAWVEEACNGTLGVVCFNQRTMRDAGFGFHVGSNGLSLSVIGARARHAGKFNIGKHLGPKA